MLQLLAAARRLSADSFDPDAVGDGLVELTVVMIFAREFIEAGIITSNFHALVDKSHLDDEAKQIHKKAINVGAALGWGMGLVFCIILGLCIGLAGNDMSDTAKKSLEAASKIIAGLCMANVCVKAPQWAAMSVDQAAKKAEEELGGHKEGSAILGEGVGPKEIGFTVWWNTLREMGEIEVLTIPFFLSNRWDTVIVSGLVGVGVSIVIGVCMYGATFLMSKYRVVIYSCILTGLLGCGLFTSGVGYVEKLCGGPVGATWWSVDDKVGGSILYIFGVQSWTAIKCAAYVLCAGTIGFLHYQRRNDWATLREHDREVHAAKADKASARVVDEEAAATSVTDEETKQSPENGPVSVQVMPAADAAPTAVVAEAEPVVEAHAV